MELSQLAAKPISGALPGANLLQLSSNLPASLQLQNSSSLSNLLELLALSPQQNASKNLFSGITNIVKNPIGEILSILSPRLPSKLSIFENQLQFEISHSTATHDLLRQALSGANVTIFPGSVTTPLQFGLFQDIGFGIKETFRALGGEALVGAIDTRTSEGAPDNARSVVLNNQQSNSAQRSDSFKNYGSTNPEQISARKLPYDEKPKKAKERKNQQSLLSQSAMLFQTLRSALLGLVSRILAR